MKTIDEVIEDVAKEVGANAMYKDPVAFAVKVNSAYLAQQEPVAWLDNFGIPRDKPSAYPSAKWKPLFLAPPPAVQQKPAGYALIINGARQGLYAFKQDAMEKGMEIGARFDLLPMYYNLPTAQVEQP